MKHEAHYARVQASFNATFGRNAVQVGVYGFAQHQYNYFSNVFTDGPPNVPASSIGVTGGVAAVFIDDTYKVNSILTLIAGLWQTNFSATISEGAMNLRIGATVRVPHLNWVFRGL